VNQDPTSGERAFLASMRRVHVYPMVQARDVSTWPARPTIVRAARDSALGLFDAMAPRDDILLQQLDESTKPAPVPAPDPVDTALSVALLVAIVAMVCAALVVGWTMWGVL